MSVDEVRRKLEEIKAMYGGPPPQQIIDVTPEDLEDDPEVESEPEEPSIIEQFRDAEKAESSLHQRVKENLPNVVITRLENRVGLGLPDCLIAIPNGVFVMVELSGEPGTQGPAESASSGVQPEARDDGLADVDSDAVSPEGHHQTH